MKICESKEEFERLSNARMTKKNETFKQGYGLKLTNTNPDKSTLDNYLYKDLCGNCDDGKNNKLSDFDVITNE